MTMRPVTRKGKQARPSGVASGSYVLSWDGRLIAKEDRPVAPGELRITWRPCVIGGNSAPTLAGLGEEFLPRGVALRLVKLRRAHGECIGTYRVQIASD